MKISEHLCGPLSLVAKEPFCDVAKRNAKLWLSFGGVSVLGMASSLLDTLSAEHREAVRSALKAAFGSEDPAALVSIGGGASGAFAFRVEIGGRHCLVRVEGPASPLRNPHQYESMRIAAEAKIAPRVYHVDEMSRVVVMDFIEQQPLNTFPGGPQGLAQAVGALLANVQKTQTFPHFIDYPEMVGRLWWWVCQTGLLAPGVLDPCTERLERIRETYAWDPAKSVSSHNDPVPRNVLFDGRRLWLIDWESAYRNDPLVDAAITLDSFAHSPELEQILLHACLGREPDSSESDRLAKVRALTRLYYAGVLLSASAAASGALADSSLSPPAPDMFRHAVRDGQIIPGSPEAKHTLGKIYLSSFLTGDIPPGLDAAV